MSISTELQRCISILQSGGLLVAPSDTVYGLVCDATNEEAVKKLISVKNRPWGKPISVFTDGFEMMNSLVDMGSHKALLHTLLPGPFTVILPSKHKVSPLLESERKTLGVRLPANEWIQNLVHAYGKPLTATSANISGRPPHYEPQGFMNELSEEKKKSIDYVVDQGKLPRNKPSTIIDLTGSSLQLLRQGDVLPESKNSFTSNSAQETKKIATYLAEKYAKQCEQKPVVFILEGEMGVGKTVFAQGLGEFLGLDDIVSPTYVIYYEYPVKKRSIGMFLHADLYNIEESEEYVHLGLEEYFKKQTMICIEWGNRIGPLFDFVKKTSHVVIVEMSYKSEKQRTLLVKDIHE
ncbi:MAG: L-threonylcarbamoyladenylate synthase [Candidatus Roizmanbacteria bacterium]|nr:L-threonylcarbamoyladenylate synthase [Candidatus Roizmanbacteria bacterium]